MLNCYRTQLSNYISWTKLKFDELGPYDILFCWRAYKNENLQHQWEENKKKAMEEHALKSVNKCLNTNIFSYSETSGGQGPNLYLNVVHFFFTSVNLISVAALDSCFLVWVSNMCCSFKVVFLAKNFLPKNFLPKIFPPKNFPPK